MKYSTDGLVRFDPSNHTYWKGEQRLQGVTSLIKKFTEPFDLVGQAMKKAAKTGEDPYELMKQWKQKGLDSRIAGTDIHNVLETYCETGEIRFDPGPSMKKVSAIKFIIDYFKTGRLIPHCYECLVYQNNTASMIDLVALNPKGETFILDYKSSKEISKDGWGRKMKSPFQDCEDSNFYHYSIQLSIYEKLLGRNVKGLYICHIKDSGYELIAADRILIPNHIL